MSTKIIKVDFENHAIQFEENGWFNATVAAEAYGKRPIDWLNQDGTKEYISALSSVLKCEPKSLLKTKRGNSGGTWMHPKLAVRFAQWLDSTFAVWCDLQIDNLIHGKIESKEDIKRVRHEASSSNKLMNSILNIKRFEDGKDTCSYHYMNEAKMVNSALTGEFKGVNRDDLSFRELDILAKLEARNTLLIAQNLDYHERKIELHKFADQLKRKLIAA